MTVGFIVALLVYTKIIRKEVDQQLSIEVNKMVENYVDLASIKSKGNSYSKFDSWLIYTFYIAVSLKIKSYHIIMPYEYLIRY